MTSRLQFPALSIKGFRGIRSLEISDFGRVTLLTGKNSIGKTTVLEAIRLFASRGDNRSIISLLEDREELLSGTDEDGNMVSYPNFVSLFHNYNPGNGQDVPSPIEIAVAEGSNRLTLNLIDSKEHEDKETAFIDDDLPLKDLHVTVGKSRRTLPVGPIDLRFQGRFYPNRGGLARSPDNWPDPIAIQSLGPGLPNNYEVTKFWDNIALTDAEDFVVNALRLVVGEKLERLAVIGDASGGYRSLRRWGRRFVAKFSASSDPIPLKRLGDGAQRLLGIALALENCRNGILLIDEIENGIHYSVMPKLWEMIFKSAREGNVQVIAATHSWDCVASFAFKSNETDEVGALVRLESGEDDLFAVHYDEDDLKAVAEQRIEVR